jgi:hypothetical protein
MVVRNPKTPVAIALVRIPLPAMILYKQVIVKQKVKVARDYSNLSKLTARVSSLRRCDPRRQSRLVCLL